MKPTKLVIKNIGKIAEPVDSAGLKRDLQKLRDDYAEKKSALEKELEQQSIDRNEKIRAHNQSVDAIVAKKESIGKDIERVEAEILAAQKRLDEMKTERSMLLIPSKKELVAKPNHPDRTALQKQILDAQPDTTELEAKIQNAAAQNVRAEQYAANKKRAEALSERNRPRCQPMLAYS